VDAVEVAAALVSLPTEQAAAWFLDQAGGDSFLSRRCQDLSLATACGEVQHCLPCL
jgi:hypothetical protein